MRFFSIYALTLVVTAWLAAAESATCADDWLFVDIHYRVVDARNESLSYGLFMGAGTGSQNQSLWPAITQNETRLASNDFCSPQSPKYCTDASHNHGHFGPDASTTWIETPQYRSLDSASLDDGVNVTYGQDNFNIYTHYFDPSPASKFIVTNHSLTLMSDFTKDQDVFFHGGSLGLGPASTLMRQLINVGRIKRNVFSIYLGTAYPRAGGTQNGSLVLGGYDSGRLQGDVHKYSQQPAGASNPSPFRIHVKQMALVTEDGSSIGLVTDGGFDAYVSTSQYEMELPNAIAKSLSDGINATPSGSSNHALQLAKNFQGNISITLDDGYTITYTSDWISNASGISPFVSSSLPNNGSQEMVPLIFGTAFLQHLYMTVDYDDSSFYLADAKIYDNYVQPRSLCTGDVPVPMGSPKINRFLQTGMIGAILGGLIGGMGLVWFLAFCVRRNLQHKQSEKRIKDMESGHFANLKSAMKQKSRFNFFKLWTKPEKSTSQTKRVSFSGSDSDSSSLQKVRVKTKTGPTFIEMSDLPHYNTNTVLKTTETPGIVLAPALPEHSETTKTTVIETPWNGQGDPASALPTPYTARTPRTGNPLLGDRNRRFAEFDDDDDSDLNVTHELQPEQTKKPATGSLRHKSRLSLNTRFLDARNPAMGEHLPTNRSTGLSRPKPAPLPLQIVNSQDASRNSVKSSGPLSPLSIKAQTEHRTRHSMLRKMFPAS